MNSGSPYHLKNQMNSASCAPEILPSADVMPRRARQTGRASLGPEQARPDLDPSLLRKPRDALRGLSLTFSGRWSCGF